MDAKATLIGLTVLFACLLISAKCEGDGPAESHLGGLRRQPYGEETMRSNKINIWLCDKRTCKNSYNSCYCCPGKPCYMDQKQCQRACATQQTLWPALPAPEPSSVGSQQVNPEGDASQGLGLIQFCDIC
ncbi:hypothetical protein EJB05_24795 [Eragrostis curvula]|uniref:Embryo surrounding factor 1 brassicaceae domain-containing protein n=1 Tax=Eragrostis curvula TaxID=38414 RepID=A0A5J9VAN8_9POAL|nr:hypothetical protein EJB05_24795 [Eragrostis curvula]